MVVFTPRQRMLNAYRGISSDRAPVSPEFWNYYPAKVLGIPMIELEREIPFWQALKVVFERYQCEGFGIAMPETRNPDLEQTVTMQGYEETTTYRYRGQSFTVQKRYDPLEPCWVTKRMADDPDQLPSILDMLLDPFNIPEFTAAIKGHEAVGESYLLELWCGVPFFDFIAELLGFEEAVLYFADEDEAVLQDYRSRYTEYQKNLVRQAALSTPFESFMIGCSYSCNSLIGKNMWRKWDKPYLKSMADELHGLGKLLHVHFHGRSIDTVSDFAEIGLDCVCPFERGPGGDINTQEDLALVRQLLDDQVTFNGNVHTINTLIRGTLEQVRQEVREIKLAFRGSNRYIIGTGDQVGGETPEENILAMIEEGKKQE